jgi:hypothetical protein
MKGDLMEFFKDCGKCYASGEYVSRRGNAGKCFACYGTGRVFRSKAHKATYKAEKAKKTAAYLAKNARWLVTVSFLYAATGNPIAHSVVSWALRGSVPTPKMVAAVYRAVVRFLNTVPEKTAPVVVGKGVTVEGKVLTVKERPGFRGGYTLKMLVKDERGFKVWGTVPRALVAAKAERGSVVRFVANTKVSDDDETFGFFSRPRKAELLAA